MYVLHFRGSRKTRFKLLNLKVKKETRKPKDLYSRRDCDVSYFVNIRDRHQETKDLIHEGIATCTTV